jgi:hypothetical protein
MEQKTISARVSSNFAETARQRQLSVCELADQCLNEMQTLRVREQELALARLDKMDSQIKNYIVSNEALEHKLDTLTELLTDLFRKLGE